MRVARRRARRARWWLATVAVAGGLAAIPVSINTVQRARAAAIERRTVPAKARVEESRRKLRLLRARCAQLSLEISRASALRAKRPWAGLLQLIAGRLPQEIWLTRIESVAAEPPTPVPPATPDPEDTDVRLDGPGAIRIRGYALAHESIYEWIDRLKKTQVFTRVQLAEAVKEPMLQGEAVRFELECRW